MFFIQLTVHYLVPTLALIFAGAYLEHRFGSKVTSRVAAVEARLAAVEAKVVADVSTVKQAL
jgi:hypothetical protein